MPVLLYGYETWLLDQTTLSSLESFQMEIGRRVFKLTFFSNSTVRICLRWPSMASRILVRKLQFLTKLLQAGSRSTTSQIFTAAAITDPRNVSSIQQCRMLENITETNTLHSCLENPEAVISIIIAEKKNLYKRDYACLISQSYARPDSSSFFIASVAKENTWHHLWDLALNIGTQGMKQIQRIIYNLGRPIFGTYTCPICNTELMKPSLCLSTCVRYTLQF